MATKKTTNRKSTSSSSAKSAEAVKKPLISTARKIGIAVYFTFLATLALAFGITVWMADVFNAPNNSNTPMTTDPQTQTTTQNDTPQQQTFDNQTPPTTQDTYQNDTYTPNNDIVQNNEQNQALDQQYDLYCPNGECAPLMRISL